MPIFKTRYNLLSSIILSFVCWLPWRNPYGQISSSHITTRRINPKKYSKLVIYSFFFIKYIRRYLIFFLKFGLPDSSTVIALGLSFNVVVVILNGFLDKLYKHINAEKYRAKHIIELQKVINMISMTLDDIKYSIIRGFRKFFLMQTC